VNGSRCLGVADQAGHPAPTFRLPPDETPRGTYRVGVSRLPRIPTAWPYQRCGIFFNRPSKTQGGLDLLDMREARYRRPIHDDGPDGDHHGSTEKHRSTGTRGRIVLAGIVPFIGVGHQHHLAGKGHSRSGPERASRTTINWRSDRHETALPRRSAMLVRRRARRCIPKLARMRLLPKLVAQELG
jgi:hypothetical protein